MKALAVVVVAGVLSGCFAGCAKEEPKDTVARAGGRVIDLKELNRSYSLHPEWQRGQTLLATYLTQLDRLLLQKIYAQEAERLGLDRDSTMQAYLQFVRDKETIKGLYRRQVRERVRVDEAEARQAYEWMKKKVSFEYIFTRDSAACARYAKELRSVGVKKMALPADSSVQAGTREDVQYGSLASEVEPAVFDGKLNEVSTPVRVANGYMAVKVVGGEQNVFLSENEFILQRQKVEKVLSSRKADSIASAYVRSVMQDKDLKLNPSAFWAVAEYFGRRVEEAHVDPMKMQSVYLTSDEIRLLSTDLTAMSNEVIATHREGTLTVGQLLAALANMPGSLRPRVRTPQNLKDAIGVIVRNQYLLKEAKQQGLENDPGVQYEYALQRDETLASAYYGRRRGEVTVTPEEVEVFKKHSPVSEQQVFFKFNMASLARDAKVDSLLAAEAPRLKEQYHVRLDTAKVRASLRTPDAVVNENPMRIFVREIFQ